MKTTNVSASDLNYDRYTADKYDRDIVNSIPFHRELHEAIIAWVRKELDPKKSYSILDLGVGTGITSQLLHEALPHAQFDLVDFSEQMLNGAKKKMKSGGNVKYILGDYSKLILDKPYDLVVSVIGMHHQNTAGKKKMLKKIAGWLKPGGAFIFGDLVTYRDKKKAALNQARHFHHLVEKSSDEKTLTEWAHHHLFLNEPAPIEEQLDWLKSAGLKPEVAYNKCNTALIVAKK